MNVPKKTKAVEPWSFSLSSLLDSEKVVSSWAPPSDEAGVSSMLHWRGSPSCAHLRASLFPLISRQPKNLLEILRHAGMMELIQPISWAMRTLVRHSKTRLRRRVIRVPVDRILSNIWMPSRVANILRLNAQGSRPPAVFLARVRFKDEYFYIVDDGHHRCEVAKMNREKTIKAEIVEESHFVPSDWYITRHGFKNIRTGQKIAAAKDLRAAARWLGVSNDRNGPARDRAS